MYYYEMDDAPKKLGGHQMGYKLTPSGHIGLVFCAVFTSFSSQCVFILILLGV